MVESWKRAGALRPALSSSRAPRALLAWGTTRCMRRGMSARFGLAFSSFGGCSASLFNGRSRAEESARLPAHSAWEKARRPSISHSSSPPPPPPPRGYLGCPRRRARATWNDEMQMSQAGRQPDRTLLRDVLCAGGQTQERQMRISRNAEERAKIEPLACCRIRFSYAILSFLSRPKDKHQGASALRSDHGCGRRRRTCKECTHRSIQPENEPSKLCDAEASMKDARDSHSHLCWVSCVRVVEEILNADNNLRAKEPDR